MLVLPGAAVIAVQSGCFGASGGVCRLCPGSCALGAVLMPPLTLSLGAVKSGFGLPRNARFQILLCWGFPCWLSLNLSMSSVGHRLKVHSRKLYSSGCLRHPMNLFTSRFLGIFLSETLAVVSQQPACAFVPGFL